MFIFKGRPATAPPFKSLNSHSETKHCIEATRKSGFCCICGTGKTCFQSVPHMQQSGSYVVLLR